MKSCLFQALESSLGSAIQKANQVVDASANSDVMTSDERESAADNLHATIESVVSAGLGKSHPLVKKAAELEKSLRDDGSKIKVSAAAHVVSIYLNDCVSGVASVCVAIRKICAQGRKTHMHIDTMHEIMFMSGIGKQLGIGDPESKPSGRCKRQQRCNDV